MQKQLAGLSISIYKRSGLTRAECEDDAVTALFEKMTSTFALGVSLEEILALHRELAAQRKPVCESLPA